MSPEHCFNVTKIHTDEGNQIAIKMYEDSLQTVPKCELVEKETGKRPCPLPITKRHNRTLIFEYP